MYITINDFLLKFAIFNFYIEFKLKFITGYIAT